MKRTISYLAVAASFLLSGCTDGSSFPEASGKASVTAINAIYASPGVNFLIEERGIATVAYKSATTSTSYDDLTYRFNFEIFFAGDTDITRVASRTIDFVADQHYTLLASGSVNAPTITVWETAERDFSDGDTVFQARFAHTSISLPAIDVYFNLDGVAPVLGEQVASLGFGEISGPLDFSADDYVVTITTRNDPADVLFQSQPSTILARTDLIVTPFDGDANDTSPIVVRGLNTQGGGTTFHDPAFPSTLEFLNAAFDLGSVDIYDDEMLTSQIITALDHRDLSARAPLLAGDYEYFYTPTGDTSMVSLESTFSANNGTNYRIVTTGSGGTYTISTVVNDARSIQTAGKLTFFNSSSNFDTTDLYVVEADTSIENTLPFRSGILSRVGGPANQIVPGSYDLYLTDFLMPDTTIAGPFRLDIAAGDVIDLVAYDTADTAVLEFAIIPNP